MKEFDKTAVLIEDGDLIFNYVDYYIEDGFLVIVGGKNYLLTDGRYIEHAKVKANATCYLQAEISLEALLKEKQVNFVGLVYSNTSATLYDRLISNGYKVYDYSSSYNSFSAIKSQTALSRIERASFITETAFFKTLPSIKEGITELELSAILEYNFKMLGGTVGFETIVAFGNGGSVPHYKTSDKKLEKNQPILMDFGACYNGYLSDMTRTLFFGKPTDKFLSVYKCVQTAWEKAYDEIKSGITCREADGVSRSYLETQGLAKYFKHSLGHGVGVKIHEFPTLNTKSDTVLENGMVFSIEPGVYLENEFGVRIEDTVALVNGRCKSFMKSSKDPIIISAE